MLVPQGNVLIVDDNPANLDLLGTILRDQGFRVRAVPSGRMAIDAALKHPPELILLDITMPGMDGFETCKAMKADARLASIPIIFISALDDSIDKVKAFQAGGRDYVTKPFQAEEVLARVEHHIGLARLQKELTHQNESLIDANLKLKEMSVMKGNFTAMLVHDIRNPLTVVGLVVDEMRLTGSVEQAALEQANHSMDRVHTLLKDMLEIYRSERGETPLEFSEIETNSWLSQIAEAHRLQAEAKGLTFQFKPFPELPELKGDPGKLDRALANLLGNAIKYTGRGGAIKLEASLEYGDGVDAGMRWLRLGVTDTGIGIPPEQLPFIWDPFRQAEQGDVEKGVGLGLSIVQRLVAAHKGRVQVSSQIGTGSCFVILLPC
jgi:two-component system sensor histidine kinase/response regulator